MSAANSRKSVGTPALWLRSGPRCYGFAVLAVAAATAMHFGLDLFGPFQPPFILFYPAIVLVALLAGVGPGIVATLLATLAGWYFFLEPRNSLKFHGAESAIGSLLFAIIGLFLTYLAGRRQRIEQALRESDADLNRAQAVAGIGSWRHNVQGNTLVLSDEACRIMGLPAGSAVTPDGMMENIHPDDRLRIREEWASALMRGAYEADERVFVGGRTRWVRIRAGVERDVEGRPTAAVGTVQDITERKEAEERLEEFQRVVEGLEEMIVVVDRDYRYVIANKAFLKYRGMKPEQVIGRSAVEVLERTVFESEVKPKLDECFRGRVTEYELKYEYPSLGQRDLLISYFPISGPNGVDRVAAVLRDVTEKKRAVHSLKLFRTLIDQSNDAVEVVDPETLRFLDVNEAACRDLGYSREELLFLTVFDINPDIDEAKWSKALKRLQESGYLIQKGTHRRKDGSTFPVETSFKLVQLERRYVVAVSRDISERKKVEEELRGSERRYRTLFERTVAGVAIIGLDGRVIDCNDAWARIFGHSDAAECLGGQILECYPDPAYRQVLLEELKRSGQYSNRELQLRRKDGTPFWVLLNSALLTECPDQLVIQSTVFDITEHKRTEASLKASETHFRILVEQSPAGIFLADALGNFLDVNPAGSEMLGYTREDILKLAITDVVVPEEAAQVTEDRHRVLQGQAVRNEWKFRRKDGSTLSGEVLGKRLPDGRMQAILRDITERRRSEEILRQSEGRFRVALKNSPITVFNQDLQMRYTWIYNPQLYWQQEVLGKTDDEIIGPDKAAVLNKLKNRVLDTGAAVREEVVIPHNGGNYSLDITIEPLLDAEGKIVGITGAAVDIAKLRALADSLQAAKDKLVQEKLYLEGEIAAQLGFEEIIGQSPALLEVLKQARIVAATDSTVLLLGETGTGKELVARAVHRLSARREKNFIKLNCAAVPSGLLESELFGHEKGAFTGAVNQKVGRIELADGGTLFLDEIGELPLELQPKLLRVLQDREFERLGGVRTLRVDVRIISATNRDLRRNVAEKKFREDLFYRLNVFPVQLPPLRERRSDIPMLVKHFVQKHAGLMGKKIESIPAETLEVLQNWNWPGNIRELENMIERMVILTKGVELAASPIELESDQRTGDDDLTEMEREHIIRILRDTNGVLSGVDGAASRLGLKRTTLQSMLKRFNIELREYRRGTGTFGAE